MGLKKKLQKIRISLGKFVIDKKPHNRLKDFQHLKNILFLRHDGKIGDYIVSSFIFREIKKQQPAITIHILASKENQSLLGSNPYIDNVFVVKKRSIIDYIRIGLILRKRKYDAVVDISDFLRNRNLLLLRLINASNYVGYHKKDYQLFNINIENNDLHFTEIYATALNRIGFLKLDTQYDIPHNADSAKKINVFLAENKLTNFIAINFFGNSKARHFYDSRIQQFLDYLTKIASDKKIVVLTFPAITTKLTNLAKNYANVFLYQNTQTIFDSIEIIRHARLLISPDTSVVHIAAGLNKKIIAFYGDSKVGFAHWKPFTQQECQILFYKYNINEIEPDAVKVEWLE